ncbi:MAG TPA: hypothetical protein VHZ54_00695 [Solirubrobacterales bacterium]|nr:hypothetical protein [Solirubrobacterales bacterium]
MDVRRRSIWIGVLATVAVAVGAIGAGSASAATPTLEFKPGPLVSFPIEFEAEGGAVSAMLSGFDTEVHCAESEGYGQITEPHRAFSEYAFYGCETIGGSKGGQECESEDAEEAGEIWAPHIDAELVFINQATKAVGMLLSPGHSIYMEFECGGENVKALGPFVSPIGPINQESTTFTASLTRSGATQIPSAWETPAGQLFPAVPTGQIGSQPAASTGVELSFTIFTEAPLTVRAITAAEEEARQRADEEAAKKKHDEEEAAKAAAAKKKQDEETAAAAKKHAEEEAVAKKKVEAEQAKAKQQRAKALKQCRKTSSSKQKRARCERRAKKRFAVPHPSRRY